MWSVYGGSAQEYLDMALRNVESTFPTKNTAQFKADFSSEFLRLAALKIPGGNLRTCVGVAIATV